MTVPISGERDRVQQLLQLETMQMRAEQLRNELLSQERYQQPKRLQRYGFKAYAQNDEDGILQEIFRRIGVGSRRFLEFGIQHGLECCTAQLLLEGWSGIWLEGDAEFANAATKTYLPFIKDKKLRIGHAFITPENVDPFLMEASGGELDLLVIDIDGNDYWVWEALESVKPRCVCIEYNATWRPPLTCVQRMDATRMWNGTNYFGASLGALCKLGERKGYKLVGCSLSGVNAFFVRDDLCDEHFHAPYTAAEHFEPARYYLRFVSAGHPPGMGPLVTV